MLEGTDKKRAAQQSLGFQNDMVDILDDPGVENIGAELLKRYDY